MTQNTNPIASIPASDAELITDFVRKAANLSVAVTVTSSYVGTDQATKHTLAATLAKTRATYRIARERLLSRVGCENEPLVRRLDLSARAYETIRLRTQEHYASLPTVDFVGVATKLLADMGATAALMQQD